MYRFKLLTPRENEIAQLVARGLCNKLIARDRCMSEGTVKVHLHRIYQKLGVSGRTQLAVLVVTGLNAASSPAPTAASSA